MLWIGKFGGVTNDEHHIVVGWNTSSWNTSQCWRINHVYNLPTKSVCAGENPKSKKCDAV